MNADKRDDSATEPRTQAGVVYRLLDPAFGFFVWALHFVIVYATEAVACVLGLGSRPANVRASLPITLAVFTVGAAAIVVLHGVRRFRQRGEMRDHGFLARIAVGHDSIAALAIAWQLFPIFMMPVCG
jgi:hypothetical protein